ncbi:MAG: hypothetical protein IKV54_00715 [Clostridia bacterium]|nr:hypothetical protein [Clostridia bacterium]
MLERYFVPDYLVSSYRELTPEFFECIGAKVLITEIDGVLSDFGSDAPSAQVKDWLDDLSRGRVRVVIVSNRDADSVGRYCSNLSVPAYADAKKPSTGAVITAMKMMGGDPGNTVLLGGRLLMDVFAGNRLGLTTVAIDPAERRTDNRSGIEKTIEKKYADIYKQRKNRGSAEF